MNDPFILPPYRIQWRQDRSQPFQNALLANGSVMTAQTGEEAKGLLMAVQSSRGGQARTIYQHVIDATDVKPAPSPIQV